MRCSGPSVRGTTPQRQQRKSVGSVTRLARTSRPVTERQWGVNTPVCRMIDAFRAVGVSAVLSSGQRCTGQECLVRCGGVRLNRRLDGAVSGVAAIAGPLVVTVRRASLAAIGNNVAVRQAPHARHRTPEVRASPRQSGIRWRATAPSPRDPAVSFAPRPHSESRPRCQH